MTPMNRRQFIGELTVLTVAAIVFPKPAWADKGCKVRHPLSPPDPAFYEKCPNCGMMRSMWARTWKTFQLGSDRRDACSFHCLADMAVKSGQALPEVRTALYLQPRAMITASDAWYVVGSSAKGTMTMVSKAAFNGRSVAAEFARKCGGDVMGFAAVFQMARKSLHQENAMIDRKRLAKGKIVPPVDMQDECAACRMYPSRYPRHRCQIVYGKGRIEHFCSTHCLFSWLTDLKTDPSHNGVSGMIWVTDFASGRWISGRTAYYVVNSKMAGPMGSEAVAFDRQNQARAFARENNGQVLSFERVRTGPGAWPV